MVEEQEDVYPISECNIISNVPLNIASSHRSPPTSPSPLRCSSPISPRGGGGGGGNVSPPRVGGKRRVSLKKDGPRRASIPHADALSALEEGSGNNGGEKHKWSPNKSPHQKRSSESESGEEGGEGGAYSPRKGHSRSSSSTTSSTSPSTTSPTSPSTTSPTSPTATLTKKKRTLAMSGGWERDDRRWRSLWCRVGQGKIWLHNNCHDLVSRTTFSHSLAASIWKSLKPSPSLSLSVSLCLSFCIEERLCRTRQARS